MAALMRPWSGVPGCLPMMLLRKASSAAAAPPLMVIKILMVVWPASITDLNVSAQLAWRSDEVCLNQSRRRSRSSGGGRVASHPASWSMETAVWPLAFSLASSDARMLLTSTVGGFDAMMGTLPPASDNTAKNPDQRFLGVVSSNGCEPGLAFDHAESGRPRSIRFSGGCESLSKSRPGRGSGSGAVGRACCGACGGPNRLRGLFGMAGHSWVWDSLGLGLKVLGQRQRPLDDGSSYPSCSSMLYSIGGGSSGVTLMARSPFGACSTSYSTRWPTAKVRYPSIWMAV